MTYSNAFAALAEPRRRAILEVLRQQPLSVGELAATQPVSRPAISQHLKVLAAANLVGVRQEGARRLYYVERQGLAALRHWLDAFWDDALDAFGAEVARQVEQDNG